MKQPIGRPWRIFKHRMCASRGIVPFDRLARLQLRGYQVFADAAVQAELKFTDEQKDTVKTAIADNAEKIKELFKEGGFSKETFVKMAELNKEAQAKVIGALTDAQKDQFKEMVGAEFKLQMMGKFGFKKKDE